MKFFRGASAVTVVKERRRRVRASGHGRREPDVRQESDAEAVTHMATKRADIADWIVLSFSADAETRCGAVHSLCPCEVTTDAPAVWRRVLELAHDPDANVRYLVVDALCDGSPAHYHREVLEKLELLCEDPDERVSIRAGNALARFRQLRDRPGLSGPPSGTDAGQLEKSDLLKE